MRSRIIRCSGSPTGRLRYADGRSPGAAELAGLMGMLAKERRGEAASLDFIGEPVGVKLATDYADYLECEAAYWRGELGVVV